MRIFKVFSVEYGDRGVKSVIVDIELLEEEKPEDFFKPGYTSWWTDGNIEISGQAADKLEDWYITE